MTLNNAKTSIPYIVEQITGDNKIKNFLLTLGCYEETEVTVISKLGSNFIINIKDGRYAIDEQVAKSIVLSC